MFFLNLLLSVDRRLMRVSYIVFAFFIVLSRCSEQSSFEDSVIIDQQQMHEDFEVAKSLGYIPDKVVGGREFNKDSSPTAVAWDGFMRPWEIFEDEGAILLNFSNVDVINVLKYFEATYKVVFIIDDALQPVVAGGKSLVGSKINFSSHHPMSRKEAWNVFITLLEMVGVTLQPASMNRVYRVSTLVKESPQGYLRGPLPIYIGVPVDKLPEADMRIRYVCTAKNTSLGAIKSIAKTMQSAAAPDPLEIPEINGVMITDRVYNILTIMTVIEEVDKLTSPEAMSIISLSKSDAAKIVELHRTLIKEESGNSAAMNTLGPKRTDTISFFDPGVRLIADVRRNSIIALGSAESIKKVELFIKDYEEHMTSIPYMPVHVYPLKFVQAEATAKLLQQAVEFKSESDAAKFGGSRNGDSYFSPISIIPDVTNNSLVIVATEEEYERLKLIIDALDIEQMQISLHITMLSVDANKSKALGTQLRSLTDDSSKVNYQTGVIAPGIISNYGSNNQSSEGARRLYGNLLQLVTGGADTGTTIVTLGQDINGVFGVVRALQERTDANILSEPFLLVNNNNNARIEIGESRRVVATTIINSNNTSQSYSQDNAQMKIDIRPQASVDGRTVSLSINVENSYFTSPAGDEVSSGNKVTRSVNTSVMIPNDHVIALGGLNYDTKSENTREVPFLAKIPILGWLFKSKANNVDRSILIIFIHTKVIYDGVALADEYSYAKKHIQSVLEDSEMIDSKCPVNRWFFAPEVNERERVADFFGDNYGVPKSSHKALKNDNSKEFPLKSIPRDIYVGGQPIVAASFRTKENTYV